MRLRMPFTSSTPFLSYRRVPRLSTFSSRTVRDRRERKGREEGWGRVGGKDRNDNMISGSKFQDS